MTLVKEIREYFNGIQVKFRIGAETFDCNMRSKWNKGIANNITAKDISEYFDGACLLVCVEGQSKESIINDIEQAFKYFEYFNVNVFMDAFSCKDLMQIDLTHTGLFRQSGLGYILLCEDSVQKVRYTFINKLCLMIGEKTVQVG